MTTVFAGACPHLGTGIGAGLYGEQPAVHRAGLPNGPARRLLGMLNLLLEHIHSAALGSWPQNFPFATSNATRFVVA